MGLFDSIKNQLRSVIEWTNPDPSALIYRYTDRGDEIKNASKLIVNPGQGVVFVLGGKVQAVHTETGTFDISTGNIPFWTTVTKFMQAFESENKVGIYFFKTSVIADQKWGTKSPVKYLDPVYGFPIGMRAYGNFSFRVSDISALFVNYIGTQETVGIDSITSVIADRIIEPLTDTFAEAGHGYNEIDKNRMELSAASLARAKDTFAPLGLELTDFRIENTDFDDATQSRIAKIADTQAEAIAAKSAGLSYAEMQKLGALRDAAKNEGGTSGMFVGMNAGAALGGMMGGGSGAAPAAGTPETRLASLKSMLDSGLITDAEFQTKKAEILSSL